MIAPDKSTPPAPNQTLVLLRGLGGAVLGGIAGYVIFRLVLHGGFYGLMIPGTMLGLGASLTARGKSQILAIVCAVAAIGLAIVAEWLRSPFAKDDSFVYFVTHLHQMDGAMLKLVMIGLGGACAYWLGQGR